MPIPNAGTRTSAINKGLSYLELQFNTKKFPFSSDCFGTDKHNLQSQTNFPEFPFHENFNLYLLLLQLQQHLPSSFRNKLIEAIRPKEIAPVNFYADVSDNGEQLPEDADTTSVYYHALLATNTVTESELSSLSKAIYENVNDDGVLHTYFVSKENSRYNRLDAVSIINIVIFAYAQRHESLVRRSEDYVFDWLNSGNYKSGTPYYGSPYTFLYFCSLLASTNYQTKIRFMDTLRREFNQIKREDLQYPLDYAQTILTGAKMGVYDEILIEKLLDMQNEDGSWPADGLYRTNKTKINFGSKSISTILSVLALMETIQWRSEKW